MSIFSADGLGFAAAPYPNSEQEILFVKVISFIN